ncbi:MAG: hypothetical protein Q4A25_00260 [Candidatus Saccharibacteria bacterium]|nr:hypothetical protein [Candidatus Saccharibacteria bacterium]
MANIDFSSWGIEMLKSLLRDSLENRNAEDLKAAIRELDRRNRRNITLREVGKYLDQNTVKLGTDFADALAEFLLGLRA